MVQCTHSWRIFFVNVATYEVRGFYGYANLAGKSSNHLINIEIHCYMLHDSWQPSITGVYLTGNWWKDTSWTVLLLTGYGSVGWLDGIVSRTPLGLGWRMARDSTMSSWPFQRSSSPERCSFSCEQTFVKCKVFLYFCCISLLIFIVFDHVTLYLNLDPPPPSQ